MYILKLFFYRMQEVCFLNIVEINLFCDISCCYKIFILKYSLVFFCILYNLKVWIIDLKNFDLKNFELYIYVMMYMNLCIELYFK